VPTRNPLAFLLLLALDPSQLPAQSTPPPAVFGYADFTAQSKIEQEFLAVPEAKLAEQLLGFPDRGRAGPMPPVEPLIYRLYEIVQNYGYAYKAVLNEKFGDGIMSAIAFSTKVEKETDEKGNDWAVITLRGKW